MSLNPMDFFLPGSRVDRARLAAAVEAVARRHRGTSITFDPHHRDDDEVEHEADDDEADDDEADDDEAEDGEAEDGEVGDDSDYSGTLRVRVSARALHEYSGSTRRMWSERGDLDLGDRGEDDEGAEIEVCGGEDGLKARLTVDVDQYGRGLYVEFICDLAAQIAEHMCGDARVTVQDPEDAEEWARAQDARPLATWTAMVEYLRGEYAVEVFSEDCLLVTCPIFDETLERVVRVSCSDDLGEPWMTVASTLFSRDALDPEEALIENLTSFAALSLNDGDYELTYSIPLAALHGARAKRLLTLLAEAAHDLETDHGDADEEEEEGGGDASDDGAPGEEEEEEEEEDVAWEHGAIVGPWQSKEACLAAFERELDELGWARLAYHEQGCSIVRVYDVGGTFWLSGEVLVAARLAFEHPAPRVFGAEVEYGPSGNRAVSVELWELALGDEGDLYPRESLGVEATDLDALDAALEGEVRAAARAIDAAAEGAEHELVFYRE